MEEIRKKLVEIALKWQCRYGVAPQIISAVSEYDAAILVGMSEQKYSDYMQNRTAVSRGHDFKFNGDRYQVKGTRPSGKPGSEVKTAFTLSNYDWDVLIWINYDKCYKMVEAWSWEVEKYKKQFSSQTHLKGTTHTTSKEIRQGGEKLYP